MEYQAARRPASSKVRSGSSPSFGADDHVGTCHLLCMEPPVISGCELEGQLIILEIVFSNIDIKTVTGYIVERF